MQLKPGTLLQNRKYRIEKVLGQGGFGITYLAEQTDLHRKVAIKEFFMKEYCNRDEKTAFLTTPTSGFDVLVKKYKEKFVKEAEKIAQFKHDNIIKIYEVFEEKNTAYYVMEYHDGGSLAEYLSKNGKMTGSVAQRYIKDIAGALSYIHRQKVNHLDVKPSNIMLDSNNRAILIDFGISKHYDNSGNQTSSSPVGVSKGYAPLEQYRHGGVSSFSPETDIYSLGATLYNLITGCTPPEADDVNENGLVFPTNIRPGERIKRAITMAMQPRRRNRPQSVEMFLSILDNDIPEANTSIIEKTPHRSKAKVWIIITLLAIILGFGGYFAYNIVANKKEKARIEAHGSIDGHDYVGLGLPSGLKWATCNIGANKPEEYGNNYAWGEVIPGKTPSRTYGEELGDISGSQYDAAKTNWGGSWRMPMESEFEELLNECEWEAVFKNGENGYKVTGPNGNSIYLPTTIGGENLDEGRCRYWSSTPKNYDYAWLLDVYCHVYYTGGSYWSKSKSIEERNVCCPIRPVSE